MATLQTAKCEADELVRILTLNGSYRDELKIGDEIKVRYENFLSAKDAELEITWKELEVERAGILSLWRSRFLSLPKLSLTCMRICFASFARVNLASGMLKRPSRSMKKWCLITNLLTMH